MKVEDIKIPEGKREQWIAVCNKIIADGNCKSVVCFSCPFDDTGLCNDEYTSAKEFIEMHK